MKWIAFIVVLGLLGGGAYYGYGQWKQAGTPQVSFKATPVTRGELLATIGATGTVEPEEVIDVGAQVAGQILEFGKDVNGKTIDYGSTINEGTILAKIDDSLYQSDVAQQTAAVEQAKAAVTRAQADLGQMKAKAEQAANDWARAQKLGPSDALSQVNYDQYKANYEAAKANVGVGEAAIVQAQAALQQAQASLDRSNRNLGYCIIKSPVKGVIVDRRVNIGQTVVSSLNAPSLFLIAKDLNRIQVWVAVNEADIGSIHAGQPVTFTVDALPGRTFKGQVNKVRLNATMTQNVVTYTVEVTADNSDGKLLPYLTANAQFETARHENVLMVPNAALRWTPADQYVAPDAMLAMDSRGDREAAGPERPTTRRSTTRSGGSDGGSRGTLWVKADGGLLRPLHVRTGPTDGVMTEIQGKDLTEGTEVVIGEQRAEDAAAGGAASPFMPQFRRGGRR